MARAKGPPKRARPRKKASAGRPPIYRAEFVDQARNYCLLGATDEELATFFGVDERSINRWKKAHPDFGRALKEGKTAADGQVAGSLFRNAVGFRRKLQKVVWDRDAKRHVVFEWEEEVSGDTTAQIYWIKNRRRTDWTATGAAPPKPPEEGETVEQVIRRIVSPPDRDA